MTSSPADVLALSSHPDFRNAVPTPDHFLPLVYLAGLAAADASTADVLVDGCGYGSLSMTSYTLGASTPPQASAHGAAELPDSAVVPTDETNT
jgi:4,5-DOPA dioxygenase extradiol